MFSLLSALFNMSIQQARSVEMSGYARNVCLSVKILLSFVCCKQFADHSFVSTVV